MIKLFEDFLNEYNVANSGIITMYNLDDNIIMRLEVLGASVKEESRSGKDVTYEVSFPTKEIGDDILNLLQEVDPLPMPDMVHLYPGLFENNQNIYNMKSFDDFEKTVRINESEVSFVNESTEAMKLVKQFDKPTLPKEPIKRDLTEEETEAMNMHFPMYSWSKIDADGNIVLGGGIEARGKFYITEDDLKKVLALPKVKEIKK